MKDFEEMSSLHETAEHIGHTNKNDKMVYSNEEVMNHLHELQVYQTELEMQNEALLLAKENAESMYNKYKALYDFAPIGYFILDREGIILDVNQAGETMLKKEKSFLVGNNCQNFIKEEARKSFKDFLDKVYQSSSHVNCELKMFNSQGQEIYIYIEGITTSDNSCLIAAFDITARRNSEKALYKNEIRLKELNATKDKLFLIIGHDLRGPFTSIVGFSELLMEQIQKKNFDSLERFTRIIHNSSLQAMDLLSNLLEWARFQTGKIKFNPAIISLNHLYDEVITLLNCSILQKSIIISKNIPPDLKLRGDFDMLSNVLRNIISNAIKFTAPGGKISVEAKEEKDNFLIRISDTGMGIEPGDVKKIFSPDTWFSKRGTQNEEGSGLGLLLCKEFIEIHGGRLWVESEPGVGSIFNFTIPKNN